MEKEMKMQVGFNRVGMSELGQELLDIKEILEAQGCSEDEVKRAMLGHINQLGPEQGKASSPKTVADEIPTLPEKWKAFLEDTFQNPEAVEKLKKLVRVNLVGPQSDIHHESSLKKPNPDARKVKLQLIDPTIEDVPRIKSIACGERFIADIGNALAVFEGFPMEITLSGYIPKEVMEAETLHRSGVIYSPSR